MSPEIKLMTMILKQLEIQMSVNGCGCCGSPSVTFKYKNQPILEDYDNCNFDTEEKEDDGDSTEL